MQDRDPAIVNTPIKENGEQQSTIVEPSLPVVNRFRSATQPRSAEALRKPLRTVAKPFQGVVIRYNQVTSTESAHVLRICNQTLHMKRSNTTVELLTLFRITATIDQNQR